MSAELSAESLPRSEETVKRLCAPLIKRSTRLTRGVTIFFLAAVLLVVGVVAFLTLTDVHRTADSVREDLTTMVVLLVFLGFLPAIALRYLLGRDGKIAPELVRHGVARDGRIIKHDRLGFGGMHFLKVEWQESGRTSRGSFDVEKLDEALPEGVTILAMPGGKMIGATFGDQLFLGRRA